MTRVAIGVHVHQEPARLWATLTSLREDLRPGVDLILLPDGPDEAMCAALAEVHDLPQWGTAEPLGAPACFNRLAAASTADVLLLLEGGCEVGPRWLDHLVAALTSDAQHGLAGPSTNLSWNEQCAFPWGYGGPDAVARAAGEAEDRFGREVQTLEPLHSLADFCYAVRRDVVSAVGAADEEYGLGPCWEMDYNIRAARAGFRGVWVKAAYVYRPTFTERRRIEEARLFDASRRRYQDKLCGLRLRGENGGYEAHCLGDACEHFAPPALIQISRPLRRPAEPASHAAPSPRPAAPSNPLVSCILPTRNRADFVLQSIRYFERQDYPERELVIVDDGDDDLASRLPARPRIRYRRLAEPCSIGEKRNLACGEARGTIIAHWDDDDWYAPGRLSAQVAPLLAGVADITALRSEVFFELPTWTFWTCTPELHRRLFVEDVHGGTLVYRREVLQLSRYPEQSLAEDAAFLHDAVRHGARLQRVDVPGLFVYLRHASNAWSFRCGELEDPAGWRHTSEPDWPAEDRAFYAGRSMAFPGDAGNKARSGRVARPRQRVSCIMPTYDRRAFVPRAIEYFLRQDYPERELVVIDDGSDPVGDLIPADPRIRYLRLPQRQTIGEKRNRACHAATGEIIVHWDDDDWSAPWRLRYQVEELLATRSDICGLDHPLFYSPASDRSWQYVYPAGEKPWLYGATLCYTRAFWERQPFQALNAGEDNEFVWSSSEARLTALPNEEFHISLVHGGNTSPKDTQESRWRSVSTERIRTLLGDDHDFYRDLTVRFSETWEER